MTDEEKRKLSEVLRQAGAMLGCAELVISTTANVLGVPVETLTRKQREAKLREMREAGNALVAALEVTLLHAQKHVREDLHHHATKALRRWQAVSAPSSQYDVVQP